MATKQFGKLKLHCSKRGIAYKWGDGEIHRLSFDRFTRGGQGQPDGYEQDGYYEDPGYEQSGYYEGEQYELGKYGKLYSNDWVMYALLVLLPPLGIWILWKRERFTPMLRGILSIASLVWFILLLIWLFSAMFGGGSDPVTAPPTVSQIAPSQSPIVTTGPDTTGDIDLTTGPPASTPRPNSGGIVSADNNKTQSGTSDANDAPDDTDADPSGATYVWASNTGTYYHKDDACVNLEEGATRVELPLALQRGATRCPTCYPDSAGSIQTFYYTKSGKFYHKDKTCGNMTNPTAATPQEIKKTNKTPCPKCVGAYYGRKDGKWYHAQSNCSGMTNAQRLTNAQLKAYGLTACPTCIKKAKSGTTAATKYFATSSGKYYHKSKTCPTLKGVKASLIKAVTKETAEKNKKTACPTCLSASTTSTAKSYYATSSGKYYHVNGTCTGMKNAKKITLTTAKKYGKAACPTCIGKKQASGSTTAKGATAAAYYSTTSGNYYHKSKSCSTLKNVKPSLIKKVTKATAQKYGKSACPTCLSASATTYCYATTGGKYYHKNSTCTGMKNARRVTLAAAKKSGKVACSTCYKSAAAKATYYYGTANSRYYHVKAACSGMKNAKKITLATAKKYGKTACPTCIGKKSATPSYYASKANRYYHLKKNCSGLLGASKVTAAAAKRAGKTACPVCVTKKIAAPTKAPKVYCYASTGSKYYHKLNTCSGIKNAKKVPLSTAKKKGKTACPVCVTKKIKTSNLTTGFADKKTTCYASNSSAYYHSTKSCVAGLKASTVTAAKKKGKTACPTCASDLNTYVYVTRSGTKYHRKNTCSGAANAYKVSLGTALRLNYVRCTKCNAPKPTTKTT